MVTPTGLGANKVEKILQQSVKTVLTDQGLHASTRSGNKELSMVLKRIAKSPFESISQVQAVGEKLGQMILTLSEQNGKQNLDAATIRKFFFQKDWAEQLSLPQSDTTTPVKKAATKQQVVVIPPKISDGSALATGAESTLEAVTVAASETPPEAMVPEADAETSDPDSPISEVESEAAPAERLTVTDEAASDMTETAVEATSAEPQEMIAASELLVEEDVEAPAAEADAPELAADVEAEAPAAIEDAGVEMSVTPEFEGSSGVVNSEIVDTEEGAQFDSAEEAIPTAESTLTVDVITEDSEETPELESDEDDNETDEETETAQAVEA